jgi:hypothetical protein
MRGVSNHVAHYLSLAEKDHMQLPCPTRREAYRRYISRSNHHAIANKNGGVSPAVSP